MIQLRFLGKTRIDDAKGQPMQLATRKTEQVLAYLWLKREAPQSRERMAVLFWPDSSEEKARASLRNAIFELNKKIPTSEDEPLILTTRTTAQFNRKTAYWMDVEEFEKLLKSAEESPQETAIPPLREAVALYQGDFLEESYDDWVLEARDYFRELYLNALRHLVRACKEQEDYPQAIAYAKQSLAKNALQEEIHRDLMLLYYAQGDRNAAVQAYQDLTKLLQTELEIDPLPETQELYKLILERASASVLEEKSKRWKDFMLQFPELGAPFIGRVEECGRILSAWDAAAQGKGQAILVSGEAGSGKTRLAQEVVNYIQAQGGLVLTGQSYESEGQMPYQPWMEILRQVIEKVPMDTLNQLAPFWLNELIKLLPEMSAVFPDIASETTPLTPSQEKNNLFEAISQIFLFLSRKTPLVICIDDLQWADQPTLQLLHYIARRLKSGRILVLGMHRAEFVVEGHPLKDFINTSVREGFIEQLKLPLFTKEQIVELARGMLHSDEELPEEFVDKLERSSRGNAFFVVELVQSYVQSGSVYLDDKMGWRVVVEKLAGSAPPRKVEAIVEDRLRPITSRSREILNLVSTRSRAFELAFLQLAMERAEEDLVMGLEELLQMGLLLELGGFYQFKHDVIREVVYRNLLPERKRRLHLQSGQVLEKFYEKNAIGYGVAVIGEISDHFSKANEGPKTLKFSLLAGEYAWSKSYSKEEALYFFQRALDLAEQMNEQQGLTRVYKGLGAVYCFTDEQDRGLGYCEKALDLSTDPDERADIFCSLAQGYHVKRDLEKGLAVCEQALTELSNMDASLTMAKVYLNATTFLNWLSRYDEAINYCKSALAILEKRRDNNLRALILSELGHAYNSKGQLALAAEELLEAAALSEKLGDPYSIGQVQFKLGIVYDRAGQFDLAMKAFLRSLQAMEQLEGRYDALGAIYNRLTYIHMRSGELDHAITYAQKQLKSYMDNKEEGNIAMSYGILGCLYDAKGSKAEAAKFFDQAIALSPKWSAMYLSVIISFLFLGDVDSALTWLERGYPHLQPHHAKNLREGLPDLAETPAFDDFRQRACFITLMR